MTERPSLMQIEATPNVPSEPPEQFDVTKDTRFVLSAAQLWRGGLVIAALVLAVAAILPNILPRTFTIATQSYVDDSVTGARAASTAAEDRTTAQVQAVATEVGAIKVKVVGLEDVQRQARAAQEADRVTRSIRDGDERVREYQRVYEHGLRNMKAQREPLEGVDLP